MKTIWLAILAFLGFSSTAARVSPTPFSPSATRAPVASLTIPVPEFYSRITKKTFGTYVTPQNSPVSPERFTGFHTGVDVEYSDVAAEVPVSAVYAGQIIYSGWVSGYGGLIAERIHFNNNDYVVIYGHLAPQSLIPKGMTVEAGQKIGVLGKGYSTETDGERRHLHLAFVKGDQINFRGYAATQGELSKWENPLTLFRQAE